MIVIAAGLIRSGSTWQFNCLRVIMEKGGMSPICVWINDYRGQKGNVLIKTHEYKDGLATRLDSKVFTTIRDEEEIKNSMRRRAEFLKKNPDPRFMGTANPDRYPRYYKWFVKWRAHTNYNMQYSELIDNPLKVINDHIKVLGLTGKVYPDEVLQTLNDTPPPAKGWDASTFYHAGHITKP